MSFIDWVTGRSKYLKLLNEQQKIVDELKTRLSCDVGFVLPPKQEELESYYFAINSIITNRWFKWFLFYMRTEVVSKFMKSGEAELHRGQLSMIEIITSAMEEMSNKYQLSKVAKSE
jgi:hypothetical protein